MKQNKPTLVLNDSLVFLVLHYLVVKQCSQHMLIKINGIVFLAKSNFSCFIHQRVVLCQCNFLIFDCNLAPNLVFLLDCLRKLLWALVHFLNQRELRIVTVILNVVRLRLSQVLAVDVLDLASWCVVLLFCWHSWLRVVDLLDF